MPTRSAAQGSISSHAPTRVSPPRNGRASSERPALARVGGSGERVKEELHPHRRKSDLQLHELRHYFASGLIAAGCDVVTVQRAMGHASVTTTLSTYAHLWPTVEGQDPSSGIRYGGGRSCHPRGNSD